MIKKILLTTTLCTALFGFNAQSHNIEWNTDLKRDAGEFEYISRGYGYITYTTGYNNESSHFPINNGHTTTTLNVDQNRTVTGVHAYFFGLFKPGKMKNGQASGAVDMGCPKPFADRDTKYVIDTSAADSKDWTCDYAGG